MLIVIVSVLMVIDSFLVIFEDVFFLYILIVLIVCIFVMDKLLNCDFFNLDFLIVKMLLKILIK